MSKSLQLYIATVHGVVDLDTLGLWMIDSNNVHASICATQVAYQEISKTGLKDRPKRGYVEGRVEII